jgi:hypothetical protein
MQTTDVLVRDEAHQVLESLRHMQRLCGFGSIDVALFKGSLVLLRRSMSLANALL